MFMKDGEELVEHPIKGGFQVNPYLTYNWSVHLSAHLAFSHTGMCIHGLCTYICTPGLFQYCICTPGLFLYLHLHTLFSLFSLSIGTPGLCQYRSTSAHLALSVHVSVHLAFVSTCICTPVCEVSMPHTCTCGFQPVG